MLPEGIEPSIAGYKPGATIPHQPQQHENARRGIRTPMPYSTDTLITVWVSWHLKLMNQLLNLDYVSCIHPCSLKALPMFYSRLEQELTTPHIP